jgi:hypothetical protein
MRNASAIAWFFMALAGMLMGGLLVVSDEPGATAGRWYLAFAAAGVGLGSWGWGRAPTPGAYVIVSVLVSVAIGVQAYWIGELAYLGLTNILMVIATIATLIGLIAWFRDR